MAGRHIRQEETWKAANFSFPFRFNIKRFLECANVTSRVMVSLLASCRAGAVRVVC